MAPKRMIARCAAVGGVRVVLSRLWVDLDDTDRRAVLDAAILADVPASVDWMVRRTIRRTYRVPNVRQLLRLTHRACVAGSHRTASTLAEHILPVLHFATAPDVARLLQNFARAGHARSLSAALDARPDACFSYALLHAAIESRCPSTVSVAMCEGKCRWTSAHTAACFAYDAVDVLAFLESKGIRAWDVHWEDSFLRLAAAHGSARVLRAAHARGKIRGETRWTLSCDLVDACHWDVLEALLADRMCGFSPAVTARLLTSAQCTDVRAARILRNVAADTPVRSRGHVWSAYALRLAMASGSPQIVSLAAEQILAFLPKN